MKNKTTYMIELFIWMTSSTLTSIYIYIWQMNQE